MKRGFTFFEFIVSIVIIVVLFLAFFPMVTRYTKTGRGLWNNQMYGVQKVDDATNYETLRNVEDTCRAMQASYKADVGTAELYMRSGNREWAQQLAIRANRTAANYNEFVRKNSFVWKGAVPSDINVDLEPVSMLLEK